MAKVPESEMREHTKDVLASDKFVDKRLVKLFLMQRRMLHEHN